MPYNQDKNGRDAYVEADLTIRWGGYCPAGKVIHLYQDDVLIRSGVVPPAGGNFDGSFTVPWDRESHHYKIAVQGSNDTREVIEYIREHLWTGVEAEG